MDSMTQALITAITTALENGATQQELASNAGISQGSVSKFLAGKTLASDNFARLALTLGGELTFPGGITARREEAGTNEELARLRAQLEAEREKTALLERLLTTALSAGRGAAAEPPAAPDQLKRKAG